MLDHGQVGLIAKADGDVAPARLDRSGSQVMVQGRGFLTEPASRGLLFNVSTAVAGVAPGTALTTSPPFTLWNPSTSGKNVSILKSFLGYVSGTLGGGSIVYASYNQGASAPTGGSELTSGIKNGLLSGAAPSSRVFQGSVIGGTPTIIRPSFVLGAALATTPTFQAVATDNIDGSIVIPPGYAFCMAEVGAAGTSPLVMFGLLFEEFPA